MDIHQENMSKYLAAPSMCFMIPVYQRNYDWTVYNCKQLWEDLRDLVASPTKTHFLGTICSKSTNVHERVIIDGQQRLTTLTLLMKAMHDQTPNEVFKKDISEHYLHNSGFGVTADRRVKLHLNRRDDVAYHAVLDAKGADEVQALDEKTVRSQVVQNYLFFANALDDYDDTRLLAVRDALDRLVVVDLSVTDENPQEIFESLNSTGLDLTDVDLLRNYLLMSLPYDDQVRLYDDYWYRIEGNVGPTNMVRFFVDYLVYVKRSDAIMLRGRRAHVNEHNL